MVWHKQATEGLRMLLEDERGIEEGTWKFDEYGTVVAVEIRRPSKFYYLFRPV